jgi:hypothetical protein
VVVRRTGFLALATGLALGGCASQPPPPPPPGPVVAYDGTYRGTVQVTGMGAGGNRDWCATNPHVVLQVRNGEFSYTQTHPNAPDQSTNTYTISIAADGVLSGQSDTATAMFGTVSGSHMAATIEGLTCVYSLAADRT